MKKLFILFIMIFTLLMSCSKQIDKNIIVNALSNISSVNVVIGNTIDYEVRILSKNNIDYNFEDLSFDDEINVSNNENKPNNTNENANVIIEPKNNNNKIEDNSSKVYKNESEINKIMNEKDDNNDDDFFDEFFE